MKWCRVTHVLCVLGKYGSQGDVTEEYNAALEARLTDVCYCCFPVNNGGARQHYQAVFDAMDHVLASSKGCLLIHGRNGKDRSPFLCYAYLRLRHKFDHLSSLTFFVHPL